MTAIQRILAVPGHISLLIFLAALTAPPGSAQAPTYATIYSFKGPPTDGGAPEASLLIGAQPELFGTTAGGGASNYGTIFELTPAIGDSWNETLLYTFSGPDGAYPNASLVANGADGFYGTTEAGGAGGGTLFQLLPPTSPGGTWTETVLYDFDPSDKSPNRTPNGAVLGPNGTLYTTTFNNAADSFRPPAEQAAFGQNRRSILSRAFALGCIAAGRRGALRNRLLFRQPILQLWRCLRTFPSSDARCGLDGDDDSLLRGIARWRRLASRLNCGTRRSPFRNDFLR